MQALGWSKLHSPVLFQEQKLPSQPARWTDSQNLGLAFAVQWGRKSLTEKAIVHGLGAHDTEHRELSPWCSCRCFPSFPAHTRKSRSTPSVLSVTLPCHSSALPRASQPGHFRHQGQRTSPWRFLLHSVATICWAPGASPKDSVSRHSQAPGAWGGGRKKGLHYKDGPHPFPLKHLTHRALKPGTQAVHRTAPSVFPFK